MRGAKMVRNSQQTGKMFFRKRKRKLLPSLGEQNKLASCHKRASKSRHSTRWKLIIYQTFSAILCLSLTIALLIVTCNASQVHQVNKAKAHSTLINGQSNNLAVVGSGKWAKTSKSQQMSPTKVLESEKRSSGSSRSEATHLLRENFRGRRAATAATSGSIQIVAVAGQWIELQCPLAAELLALASSSSPSSSPSSFQSDRSIVWRKNGARLNPLNPRHKINALNGSLIITAAQAKLDEASYECAIVRHSQNKNKKQNQDHGPEQGPSMDMEEAETEEEDSSKRYKFELKLMVLPQVAPFEFPANAQVGMKVQLICSALEGQQPISFVWLKDGQIIEQASLGQPQLVSGSSSITGTGSAQRANSLNQLHQQQLAEKLAQESSSLQPAYLSSSAQKSEYVVVIDSSASRPEVGSSSSQQQQQLLPLLSDSNIRVRQADDYSMLSIERLELKHSGRYTCSAQNEAGRASHSSNLLINAPPNFTIEPKDGDLVSGESSMIECAASGQPRPTISWLRARESSTSKLWDYLPVYDNLRYSTLLNGSLLISNVTQREQGYYICSAKNGFGPEMSKLIKITVHEPAKFGLKYKTVETRIEERANMLCAASGELPIQIEWHHKDGSLISNKDKKFIIDNENSDQDTNSDSKPTESLNQQANLTVSRLILTKSARADSGHYVCLASNKYGSDKMVTNLLVQDVPDKVTELKVTNATSTTISLRWQLAFSGNSPITSYLVQYQSDDPLDDLLMSSSNQGALETAKAAAGTSIGVAPGTGSGNEALLSNLGDVLQQISNSNLQQQQQQQQQQQLASSSAAAALRTALDALNLASSNMENADEAIDRTLVELTVEQSSTHLVVKDLSPYCVYRLRLAGINKIGLGEFSDWIRAKTEEAPPGGVALKIVAAATGPNSIKITWNPPDRRLWNGPLVGFNIGYRPIDSSFEFNKSIEWTPPTLQSIILDADKQQQNKMKQNLQLVRKSISSNSSTVKPLNTSNSNTSLPDSSSGSSRYILRQHLRQLLALQQQELVAHLTNLQRSTTYLVWIQAINKRGFGPQSHAISVKTLDDVPPSAPAIKVQSTTPNSITIAWSMLSNFVSPANQYSLFYRRLPQNQPLSGSASSQSQRFNNGTSELYNSHQFDVTEVGSEPAHLVANLESSAFIERTINSKQLMLNGNIFLNSNQLLELNQDALLDQPKPSFMHHQQSSQHYQQFVYTLDQLECGSVYEMYMTTRNSVGKSEPSSIITTRTLGEPPLAPVNKNNLFSKIGINDVVLNLASWSTGGCPLTHITLRYKQAPTPVASSLSQQQQHNSPNSSSSMALSWPITISLPSSILENINNAQNTVIGNNRVYQSSSGSLEDGRDKHEFNNLALQQPVYLLKNLLPSTCYELEISAFNSAGHTTAQYELVTSNLNGTRGGFSRKEGTFRVNSQGADSSIQQPFDSPRNLVEQQVSFTQSHLENSTTSQLVPLLLMLLCFVCLIISSTFCYYRLRDSWKSQTRSLSDSSSSTSGPGSSRNGLHCQQVNSSPSSIGKPSMWRMNSDRHSTLRNQHQLSDQDSPTTMHYCMRDPSGRDQQLGASFNLAKNPSNSFSQSVSMKDFNLVLPAGVTIPQSAAGAASTLTFKDYRSRPLLDAKQASNTLRARLQTGSELNYDPVRVPVIGQSGNGAQGYNSSMLGQGQICATYAAVACKQARQLEQASYINNGGQQHMADYAGIGAPVTPYETHQCLYSNNDNQAQQAETSWTNYGSTNQACAVNNNIKSTNPTNYAIPQPTYGDHQLSATYDNANKLNYEQQEADYGENSVDTCIQQLMSQQYQQQQQQQQYAMIVNLKADQHLAADNHNRCVGESYGAIQNGNQAQAKPPPTLSGQSVVDSNSSGIDVGTHEDCGSSVTGTSNSNTSNDGYQLSQAHQNNIEQQQKHFQQSSLLTVNEK